MKNARVYIAIVTIISLAGCSNENDPVADKANFTRVYDNSLYNTSFTPIDLKQTADGGYLILASRKIENSNFAGVYLLRTDEAGIYQTDVELDNNYLHPVGDLMEVNGNYYFFCMTSSFQCLLIEMTDQGEIAQEFTVGGSYPLAASPDNGNLLLLSYDNSTKQSIISVVSPGGSVSTSQGFTIGAGDAVEEPIINHFIRTGRQYPFQVGKTAGGQYFYNGFYNYTFSLVFTDLSSSDPDGVIQGQQDDGGISRVMQLTGTTFAAARFNFGANYILPNATLTTSGVSTSVDLGGFSLPELIPNAPVQIHRTTVASREVLIYGSNTQSRQIGLFFYDPANGEFIGSKYLGFSNPYEISKIISTTDGGIAVSGTTYVAGRFPRICVFKISADELTKAF